MYMYMYVTYGNTKVTCIHNPIAWGLMLNQPDKKTLEVCSLMEGVVWSRDYACVVVSASFLCEHSAAAARVGGLPLHMNGVTYECNRII